MDNHTDIEFQIIPFSSSTNKLLLVGIFSSLYFTVIILNSVVITVICLDAQLHTPLYLFFCNLSVIDICSTTVYIPKLLHILISGDDLLSFTQCFKQIYFYLLSNNIMLMVLFMMGYDRYLAICHPLHYHRILSMRNTKRILVILWVSAFINSSSYTISLLKMTFDGVVRIHQFFCDVLQVFNASRGGSNAFYFLMCVQSAVLSLCPFLCNLISYIKVCWVIVRIKSKEGRRKAFSTCLSHLIVMTLFYSSTTSHIISVVNHTEGLFIQVLAVIYTTVVPMINPLVYSLSNSKIRKALQRLVKVNNSIVFSP